MNKDMGAAERFKLVSASYEILKDEEKRLAYVHEYRYGNSDDVWERERKSPGNYQRRNFNDASADFQRAEETFSK
jgi:DnaJ-class molecular chaperone